MRPARREKENRLIPLSRFIRGISEEYHGDISVSLLIQVAKQLPNVVIILAYEKEYEEEEGMPLLPASLNGWTVERVRVRRNVCYRYPNTARVTNEENFAFVQFSRSRMVLFEAYQCRIPSHKVEFSKNTRRQTIQRYEDDSKSNYTKPRSK